MGCMVEELLDFVSLELMSKNIFTQAFSYVKTFNDLDPCQK